MLPIVRLVFVIAILTTFLTHSLLERKQQTSDAWGLWLVLLAGFAAGRMVHVLQYWPLYQASTLDLLFIWQGGFHVHTGVLVALVTGWVWSKQQQRPIRILWIPVLTGVVIWGLGATLTSNHQPSALPIPNSIVQQLNGQPVALDALAPGQPVVINLWASWCPPCRREMPTFARAQAAHPEVRFIYANQGESLATIQQYLSGLDLNLDLVVADPRAQLSTTFAAVGLPMTLFFDAQGQLVKQHLGELSAVQLELSLQQLQEAPQ